MRGNSHTDAPPWPGDGLPRGTVLNGYRIEQVLGEGGFGITYLARDGKSQVYAIKEYFPRQFAARHGMDVAAAPDGGGLLFEEWKERFRDEKRTLSRFDNDGIVRARDFFEGNGTCYLVMEYIAGTSLAEILRQAPAGLPAARVHSLLFQLLSIVRVIHQAGLMHRDIKPDNIIVREDETVVLIDFGSSREIRKQQITEDTQIFSRRHAPPEQMMLGLGQGAFSDIYSIGSVCYQAIGGTTVTAQERYEARNRGLADPQPSAGHMGGNRYPASLLRTIDAALKIDPAWRPQNADAMFAGLETEELPEQTTVIAPQPLPPPSSRRVWWIAVGTATLLFLAGGAMLPIWNASAPDREQTARDQAARGQAARNQAARDQAARDQAAITWPSSARTQPPRVRLLPSPAVAAS